MCAGLALFHGAFATITPVQILKSRSQAVWPSLMPHGFPRWRAGITARLSVAFASVAVLAVAANLIAQQGILIVHTTERTSVPVTAPAIVIPPPPVVAPPVEHRDPPRPVDPGPLLLAIEQFERVMRCRAENDSSDSVVAFQAATMELKKVTAEFVVQLNTRRTSPDRATAPAIEAYKKQGEEFIRIEDARRASLSARVNHSGGWRHRPTQEKPRNGCKNHCVEDLGVAA